MLNRKPIRLNALVASGSLHEFEPFEHSFVLTDIVLGLWGLPAALQSSAGANVRLVVPNKLSEVLFSCWVDEYGHQVHLSNGIVCPKGSHLAVTAGISHAGDGADLRVMLTGTFDCTVSLVGIGTEVATANRALLPSVLRTPAAATSLEPRSPSSRGRAPGP